MCGMCGMFEFEFHFQSQFQFADGTTADGSYQRPSYTVAGGVLFQLLTCTTAGTRSIVTLLPRSDHLHGNDPHCRRFYKGFYHCDSACVRIQSTQSRYFQGTYGR